MSKKLEAGILGSVENNFEELRAIKKYLYDNPEVGGEAMALTALRVMEDPDLLQAIKEEFEEAKKDF